MAILYDHFLRLSPSRKLGQLCKPKMVIPTICGDMREIGSYVSLSPSCHSQCDKSTGVTVGAKRMIKKS